MSIINKFQFICILNVASNTAFSSAVLKAQESTSEESPFAALDPIMDSLLDQSQELGALAKEYRFLKDFSRMPMGQALCLDAPYEWGLAFQTRLQAVASIQSGLALKPGRESLEFACFGALGIEPSIGGETTLSLFREWGECRGPAGEDLSDALSIELGLTGNVLGNGLAMSYAIGLEKGLLRFGLKPGEAFGLERIFEEALAGSASGSTAARSCEGMQEVWQNFDQLRRSFRGNWVALRLVDSLRAMVAKAHTCSADFSKGLSDELADEFTDTEAGWSQGGRCEELSLKAILLKSAESLDAPGSKLQVKAIASALRSMSQVFSGCDRIELRSKLGLALASPISPTLALKSYAPLARLPLSAEMLSSLLTNDGSDDALNPVGTDDSFLEKAKSGLMGLGSIPQHTWKAACSAKDWLDLTPVFHSSGPFPYFWELAKLGDGACAILEASESLQPLLATLERIVKDGGEGLNGEGGGVGIPLVDPTRILGTCSAKFLDNLRETAFYAP